MESKRNETFGSVIFGTNVIQETWSGPLVAPPTYCFLLYISTYPANIQEHHENLIPPPQPSVSARSHLGAFAGAPPEGESTMEGLYIISKASSMSCE